MAQRDSDLIAHPPVSQILIMHWQASCQWHPGDDNRMPLPRVALLMLGRRAGSIMPAELTLRAATRTQLMIVFGAADGNQVAHAMLRWESTRGDWRFGQPRQLSPLAFIREN